MNGYASPAYVASLAEFGRPVHLPGCDGWLLERPLPNDEGCDLAGPYPLFTCRDWSALPADLDALAGQYVSVVLVADPFAGCTSPGSHTASGDLSRLPDYSTTGLLDYLDFCRPFKQHFVADLSRPPEAFVSSHHRRTARGAARKLRVYAAPHPPAILADWLALYAHLAARHRLSGRHDFSPRSFAALLETPGLVALAAEEDGQIVAAHLWMIQGRVAYSHLAASSERGYRLCAAYALHAFALEHLRGQVDWLDWGGAAGLEDEASGLAWFKRGWASAALPAYLFGRILDRHRYAQLAAAYPETSYFPAYRQPLTP